ncbi:hypothetical protein [Sphingomonas phage Carli]|nr:hypothetical protein [Sphingomonas phage Carli]
MSMMIQPSRFAASGPPPDVSGDPHRYWRAKFYAKSSNVASVAKLELRGAVGGPDLAAGKTIISGADWNQPVANLFDTDGSSFSYINAPRRQSAGAWAGIDFGASSADWPSVVEVLLRNGNPGTAGQGATAASIEYSDDGVTWVSAWSFATSDWPSSLENRVFTKPDIPRVIFEAQGAAVDTGPFATVLTAAGNAAISGGRFVFDGVGDYYYSNNANPLIGKLPWRATVEVFDVIAANAGFKGLFNCGGGSQRALLSVNNGLLQLWSNSGNTISIAGGISTTVPRDVKLQIEGNVARLYLDGVLGGTGALDMGGTPENAIHLGTDPLDARGRSLSGSFSGVKITQGLV